MRPVMREIAPVLLVPAVEQAGVEPLPRAAHPIGEHLMAERRSHRWVMLGVAVLIAAGFLALTQAFWVPAHAGVDQNGYLRGGRMIAQTLTMKVIPTLWGNGGGGGEFDPHQYVGSMWIGVDGATPAERFYPKYPLGYPILLAIALRIGALFGGPWPVWLPYLINPAAVTLAVLATFLLVRRVAGSAMAILGTAIFATSPTTLLLTNTPSSHATALFCVTAGMLMLIKWWEGSPLLLPVSQAGDSGRTPEAGAQPGSRLSPLPTPRRRASQSRFFQRCLALCGGFLLGYTATIRYTEATLALPLGLIVLYRMRWTSFESWVQSALACLGWLIPVAVLVAYNYGAMGTPTGYDANNESDGFSWQYAADNWDTMLRHLGSNGLFMMFPFAITGLVWMFWWNWKLATVLAAWIVPCALTYVFYYWAPDAIPDRANPMAMVNISYLRFYLTIFPSLVCCAAWLLRHLGDVITATAHSPVTSRQWRRHPGILAAAIAVGVVVGGYATLYLVNRAERSQFVDDMLDERRQIAGNPEAAAKITREIVDGETPKVLELNRVGRVARNAGVVCGAAILAAFAAGVLMGRPSAPVLAACVLTVACIAVQTRGAMYVMETDQRMRLSLLENTEEIRRFAPEGSVIFSSDTNFASHLQFVGDWHFYSWESFNLGWIKGLPRPDLADRPQGLAPGRPIAMFKRLSSFDQAALDNRQRAIMNDALDNHRRVFFVMGRGGNDPVMKGMPDDGKPHAFPDPIPRFATPAKYTAQVIDVWNTIVARPLTVESMRTRSQMGRWSQGRSVYQLIEITKK